MRWLNFLSECRATWQVLCQRDFLVGVGSVKHEGKHVVGAAVAVPSPDDEDVGAVADDSCAADDRFTYIYVNKLRETGCSSMKILLPTLQLGRAS